MFFALGSESAVTLLGADQGMAYQRRALALVQTQLQDAGVKPEVFEDLARCHHMIAGLQVWRWQMTHSEADLNLALTLLATAVRAKDQDRQDHEHHRDAILRLKAKGNHSAQTVSWVRWFQAITLADGGDAKGSHSMAVFACLEDAKSITRPDGSDIGRRQYSSLRRFIEEYSDLWQHPSLVGHVSQVLQIGHSTRNPLVQAGIP